MDSVSILDPMLDAHLGHRLRDPLGMDLCEGLQSVSALQKIRCLGMRGYRGLEHLLGLG